MSLVASGKETLKHSGCCAQDIPGHSRGFLPIECGEDEDDDCIVFCTEAKDKSQIYGDPDGKTYGVLHKLFKEMAGLFDDDVFNIGADETSAKGPCSVNSTFSIERKVVNAIAGEYKKTPEGWEELFFDAGAATEGTIVNAWARHSPSEITKTGRQAVESASDHFYFTSPGPAGPAGWSKCHYAIDTGVPDDEKKLLLGGEMSMWSDTYCDINQCGASGGTPPVGHELFYPKHDAEFGKSIGGMIWPRGYVGAASFCAQARASLLRASPPRICCAHPPAPRRDAQGTTTTRRTSRARSTRPASSR